jgi:hypothetical protein
MMVHVRRWKGSMRKKRALLLAILLVAVVGGVAWRMSRQREPVYKGKPLSYWLSESDPHESFEPFESESNKALREIGTNAIPTLLRMLRASDSSFKLKVIGLIDKQRFVPVNFTKASTLNWRADNGFSVLGERASNAVPALIQIHEHKYSISSQNAVADALGAIGPPAASAVPVLLREATKPTGVTRIYALRALGRIHAQSELVVPGLVKCLGDRDPDVKGLAASGLGQLGPEGKTAVPALVALLNDASLSVRFAAVRALGRIRCEPEIVVPALIKSLDDSMFPVRYETVTALKAYGFDAKKLTDVLSEKLKSQDASVRKEASVLLLMMDAKPAAGASGN